MSADFTALPDLASRAVQPDTRHRFVLDTADAATHLRLDVYPDGGLSRLRLFGELDAKASSDARNKWWDALPTSHQALIADQAPTASGR